MSTSTGLADFLKKLFDRYKKDRSPLDEKWQRNLNAVKGIDNKLGKEGEAEGWRSNEYIKKTKTKVFAFIAMLTDIFLQGGSIPFSLAYSNTKRIIGEEISEEEEATRDKAKDLMRNKIKEQLKERKADIEFTRCIASLGYYGETYTKYNVESITRKGYEEKDGMYVPFKKTEKIPGHIYVSVWSIFRDKEESDLQKCQGVFEKTMISSFDLRQLKDKPGYISKEIDRAIEGEKDDAVDDSDLPPGQRDVSERNKNFEHKQFWGRVPRHLVEQFEAELKDENSREYDAKDLETGDEIEVMVEMAGKIIIRHIRNSDGKRPYKHCTLEDELDETSGIGVADNSEATQNIFNTFIRSFIDNKMLTGNSMGMYKPEMLPPGAWDSFKPGKWIKVATSCDDARKAIAPIVFPDVGETLLSGIALIPTIEDEVTQIPKILQGSTLPKHKPDTLGEMNWLMDNAGKYLGMVIKHLDDFLVEPGVSEIYDYNMLNPDFYDGKGNYKVIPGGYVGFQNKVMLVQKVRQVLALVLSSDRLMQEVELRPHLEVIYRGLDLDLDTFFKSEEKRAKEIQEAQAQQEAMEAKALEAERAVKAMDMEAEAEKIKLKSDAKQEEIAMKADIAADTNEEDFQQEVLLKKLEGSRGQKE